MNKLLLTALSLAIMGGTSAAYDKATPGMMKSSLRAVSSRTLPTGEKEVTLAIPVSSAGIGKHVYDSRFDRSSFNSDFGRMAQTRAEEEPYMQFTYAGNPYTACNMDLLDYKGDYETVYMTVFFPEFYTQIYNNCRVKDILFVTGVNGEYEEDTNTLTSATVFIAKEQNDIPGNMVYSRTSRVTNEGFKAVRLNISDDYIIKEGETFYIGYAVSPQSLNDYFMVVDGYPTGDANGALVGIEDKEGKMTWESIGPKIGNLCIYLTIVGEDLPKDGAVIYNMGIPMQVDPGEEFTAAVQVINMNSNDINSIEYTYKIGDAETQTAVYELAEPLPYSTVLPLLIEGLKTDEIGLNIPFEFKITKVNGVDNYYPYAEASMVFKSFNQSEGYEPHALIEEGTSTRCGYCPIGISMMEYAQDNYPEYYHRAALHYNMGNGSVNADPMYVESNNAMSQYFEYLPSSYINRWADFYPGDYVEILPMFNEEYGQALAAAGVVDVSVSPAENNSTTVTASVKFALDIDNQDRYRVGFYITEDNLGPFTQLNYFSGLDEDYDGWEKLPQEYRKQMYNDVVRDLVGGADGCDNSLPASIKAGETYTWSAEADLTAVEGDTYNVIAFIIDKENEEILNSAVISTDMAAVEEIEAGNSVKVFGADDAIIIKGEYTKGEILSIDGKKIANLAAQEYVKVASGIYIVTVDGKSYKVLVK